MRPRTQDWRDSSQQLLWQRADALLSGSSPVTRDEWPLWMWRVNLWLAKSLQAIWCLSHPGGVVTCLRNWSPDTSISGIIDLRNIDLRGHWPQGQLTSGKLNSGDIDFRNHALTSGTIDFRNHICTSGTIHHWFQEHWLRNHWLQEPCIDLRGHWLQEPMTSGTLTQEPLISGTTDLRNIDFRNHILQGPFTIDFRVTNQVRQAHIVV